MKNPQRLVFVDRDGTINEDRGYVHRIETFHLLSGALEALQILSKGNIAIYIVTNQSGIARGHYQEHDFHTLNASMLRTFKSANIKINDVLYCPHHPQAIIPKYRIKCDCRKPAAGLLKKVIDHNEDWEPSNGAVIGDQNCDIEAGESLGLRTYLVETGHGSQEKATTRADFVMPNLKAAVIHLLESWKI